MNQVFSNNDGVKNFVLRTQAQALSGRKTKDLVYTHTGAGGNGKSILMGLIKHTFGDYYIVIPVAMLTKSNMSKSHNTPDPFMQDIKGCRFAMSSEPIAGKSLNDQLIKNIASQEPQKFRMLFSNEVVNLNIQIKLNICCNLKLKFNGDDGGLAHRMCVVDYKSKFTDEQPPNEKNHKDMEYQHV